MRATLATGLVGAVIAALPAVSAAHPNGRDVKRPVCGRFTSSLGRLDCLDRPPGRLAPPAPHMGGH